MTTQPLPAPDTTERTDSRALRVDEVHAQWQQNVGAGVGAATLYALMAWGVGADMAAHWRWALIIGGCTFGAGQVVRAFVDEWRAERRWHRRELEHRTEMEILTDECDRLEDERDALRSDNAALRSRCAWLEARLNQPTRINGVAQEPEGDPAFKDAVTLIRKRYGQGVPVTARHQMSVGWSQARYTAALDVLKDAGVVTLRGTQSQWTDYPSPDAACMALYDYTPVVLQSDTSIQGSGGLND